MLERRNKNTDLVLLPSDEQTNRRTDEQTNRRTDEQTNRRPMRDFGRKGADYIMFRIIRLFFQARRPAPKMIAMHVGQQPSLLKAFKPPAPRDRGRSA
ncbi:hypothetical protein CYG48_18825 (plasmid) [Neorhizobium sp. SOG26]|nr:hypothetical protein CYG48_18825 [Neorhizobium sp. SOG26]